MTEKQPGQLKIPYVDEHIVVVDKPGGLLAVPGRGAGKQDSVARRIRTMFPGCIDQPAVHRLDMATSGLMVLALTVNAHRHLSIQFAEKAVKKKYTALLDGQVAGEDGEITLAFRLDPNNRPCQVYDPVQGKIGITRWKLLQRSNSETRVEFTPLTGRTHQLRLHASHRRGLGCPIVGDSLYGTGQFGDPMYLHAHFLAFFHPVTKQWLTLHSPVWF
jgi:tRNA pseudouridine32 synthase/23S rRNA pseudouridine746 synthase